MPAIITQFEQIRRAFFLTNLFMAAFTFPKFTFAGGVIFALTANDSIHSVAIIRIEKKRLCPFLDTTSF